ncbi:DUF802 domain-containing protein [Hydrogenophaga sp. 5NK40-0174]|uniref:DUF802 domain-containing protein n=1 Tax=Hydrogenophaga sp. 5NK40-0174 TaxID=3127649 RepID=UPI00333F25D9
MHSSTLNRFLTVAAFGIGLFCILWIAAGFVGHNALALVLSLAIAVAYGYGAWEVSRYRRDTQALSQALSGVAGEVEDLRAWVVGLPAKLQNPVRARIEGERVALPGLTLTPYLVGLLVMLGMLGTFVGMVLTFKGAVFALEGSADLASMRAALAEPIKGLGLSFGTSVAGVAASAALGLMSAMARRDRQLAVRSLDERIANEFRGHSAAAQRKATLQAMKQQADAMPAVAERLQALMEKIDERSQALEARLVEQQSQLHSETSSAFEQLAKSVESSLKHALEGSARVAGESLQPVVSSAMQSVAAQSKEMQEQVGHSVRSQLAELSQRFEQSTSRVADLWREAVDQQVSANTSTQEALKQSLAAFGQKFDQGADALVKVRLDSETRWRDEHARHLEEMVQLWRTELSALHEQEAERSSGLAEQQTRMQEALGQKLQAAVEAISESSRAQSAQVGDEVGRLLSESEALVRARAEAEAGWRQEHSQRLEAMATLWRTEMSALRSEEAERSLAAADRQLKAQEMLGEQLQALRADEQARGDAAAARLGELQTAVAEHLSRLGAALEAPMTRLLETASEAPKAAAEVIGRLREEMSHLTERDNQALKERAELMGQIGQLLEGVQQATGEQRDAIESLVGSASGVLDRISQQFSQTLGAQAERSEALASEVAVSATELSSLGEAFNRGIELFSGTNEMLADKLQRVEQAIGQSMARSDEQLAYYVEQAREVIDLSISAQQGIVEDLRSLRQSSHEAAGSAA